MYRRMISVTNGTKLDSIDLLTGQNFLPIGLQATPTEEFH